jgi:putative membrane protein
MNGWKILAGVVAVITAQTLADLAREFTVTRLLLFLGILLAVLVVAIVASAVAWWRTTYEISADGVDVTSGLLTVRHRTAPQEKIESVGVERPALARLLGLAKVRVEIAGGSDSYVDIAYVRSAEAESIRRHILHVAAGSPPPSVASDAEQSGAAFAGSMPASGARDGAATADGSDPRDLLHHPNRRGVEALLRDGVTEGELIAEIPTTRLLHSMVRDLGFMFGLAAGVIWVIVTLVLVLVDNGVGAGMLAATLPAVIAIPQTILSRIEGGWGFVSRLTDRGLRMRRGLFSTRTDNLAPGRIQQIALRRPVLWRKPRWTSARVEVAGIDGDDEAAATNALPVGTSEELGRTVGYLLPSLGTDDDLATLEHLLDTSPREITGIRPRHRLFPIGRRTRRTQLYPGAAVLRSGVLSARIQVIPRERIQGLTLAQGPIARATGSATLTIAVAGATGTVADVPLADAVALRDALLDDAARGRPYADKDSWPVPPLSLTGSPA